MVAGSLAEGAGGVATSDKWALRFISVNYVRNILEAFDEDASGFITVKEVNDFTRSRPLDWRWVLEVILSGATRSHGPQSPALVSILGHRFATSPLPLVVSD